MDKIRTSYKESLRISALMSTRSSKRTDCIHKGIGDAIVELRPDLSYKIEQVFPTHIGTYSVDVTLFKEDKPALFILVKAPLCNIKQNITNTQNSCIGEIVKLYKSYKEVPIVMFDYIPTECPYYDSKGEIKKMEKFSVEHELDKSRKFIELTDPFNLGTPMLRDRFVLFTKLDQSTKKDIEFGGFEDDSDLGRFETLIRSL